MKDVQKAVGYIRISSTRQLNSESPETQKAQIQAYADQRKIQIVSWFYDEAVSAKTIQRPELKKLLQYVQAHKGQIAYVIVYKMTRISRDMNSYVELRLTLGRYSAAVRSATEPVDNSPSGRYMESIFMANGQLDNDMKSEYTRDNMRALARQGYWQHPPLIGYSIHKILNDIGKLRPTMKLDASADKVRTVLIRFSEGDISKAELTRFAKAIGLKSKRGHYLTETSVNNLLEAPEYAGYVHDKHTEYELVEGKHEPLISIEIYQQNQTLLKSASNTRSGEKHIKVNELYFLRGTLLCVNCGKPMYGSAPRTGNGKGYSPRYHCARKTCRGKVPSIKAETVHLQYTKALQEIKPSDNMLKLFKEVLLRESNMQLMNLNSKIKRIRNKLSEIDQERTNILKKFIEDQISLDEKNTLVQELDERKEDLQTELTLLTRQQYIHEKDLDFCANFMKNVDIQWALSDIDIKQRFQKMIFPDGVYYDPVKGKFGTSNISPLYRLIRNEKDAEASLNSNLVAGAGLEPATSWL